MFNRLQQKWRVNGWQLFLVLTCFALAGSLTGYTGRQVMKLLALDSTIAWWILYIVIVTLLWPLFVLLVSIPFGQFLFFKQYLQKMGRHIGINSGDKSVGREKSTMFRIAIFASGAGSNAAKIINHFNEAGGKMAKVSLVVCNKPGAGVLDIATAAGIPILLIEKDRFFNQDAYVDEFKKAGIDFIVLAGFLWKIPPVLIASFPNSIINIHPALLPKYGGKGMYGQRVHEAVIANKEAESGISIHWVDELYDHGSTIFQAKCPVLPGDTPLTLAARIHELEHTHFPEIIEACIHAKINQE